MDGCLLALPACVNITPRLFVDASVVVLRSLLTVMLLSPLFSVCLGDVCMLTCCGFWLMKGTVVLLLHLLELLQARGHTCMQHEMMSV